MSHECILSLLKDVRIPAWMASYLYGTWAYFDKLRML
jgi:hypothetical protein